MPRLLPCVLALVLPCLQAGCREPGKPPVAAVSGGLALAPLPAATKGNEEITQLQAQLRQPGAGSAELWARLARAFVRKARDSSDSAYYAQADDAAGQALSLDPRQRSALQVRQLVLLNGHRFVEARALAEQELRHNPRDEVAWGTLGDSQLELGNYDGALEAYQSMMDIKPDLRSYNRGAWMRWLIGDPEGAVELMQLAIDAGSPRDLEALSYCRVQLGDLHFFLGRYEQARGEYDRALRELPRYAPALAARGRLNLVTGKTPEAIADLDASLSIQPLTAVRALYIDALLAAGKSAEATAERACLEREGRSEDPRALSLYYSSHGQQLQLAVDLANEEVRRRPDIWSLDASAWALFRSGKIEEAWIAILGATRLGTRDPRLLYHRGRIAAARNDAKGAIEPLQAALAQSPSWDLQEPQEARQILARLTAPPAAPVAPAPMANSGK